MVDSTQQSDQPRSRQGTITHEERRAAAKMFFEERYKQGAAVNAALGHDAGQGGPAATRRFSSRSQSGVVVDDEAGADDVEEGR